MFWKNVKAFFKFAVANLTSIGWCQQILRGAQDDTWIGVQGEKFKKKVCKLMSLIARVA